MIPFDIKLLTVEYVRLKSVTTALGGSVTIVDPKRSTKTKEVLTKVRVPLAVARQFMQTYAVRQYLKPVRTAVVRYQGQPVALERHPQGTLADDMPWESNCETNVRSRVPYLMKAETPFWDKPLWFIDGTYVYTHPHRNPLEGTKSKSLDGAFREVPIRAIKLANLGLETGNIDCEDRVSLLFRAKDGTYGMSPPIWKTLETIGNAQFNRASGEGDDIEDVGDDMIGLAGEDHFDRIDELLCVNLAFLIKAGRELADIFGYDSIEPLNLPALMLEMKTVNLPNIKKAVKQTYDSGIPFTHVAAWLIGLLNQVQTMDSYLVIRSLLKYLSTKGVYRKNAFEPRMMYRGGVVQEVPLKSVQEAGESVFASFGTTVRASNGTRRVKEVA